MKKLLLLASILVSGLASFAQIGTPDPTPDTDPGPYVICSRFCFTNNTDCYNYICIYSNNAEDCEGNLVEVSECISLEAGRSGCIDLRSRGTGCGLCPGTFTITVCGNNSAPCFSFTERQTGGQGIINCGGPNALVTWTAKNLRSFEIRN